jgi:hypothetical protein
MAPPFLLPLLKVILRFQSFLTTPRGFPPTSNAGVALQAQQERGHLLIQLTDQQIAKHHLESGTALALIVCPPFPHQDQVQHVQTSY